MRRKLCILLALALVAVLLAGCAKKPDSRFTADNEIFTYKKIDTERTQLVVSRTGNIAVEGFCEAFEALNPDVQVIYLDITGGNSAYMPAADWVKHGKVPDVMISTGGFFSDENLMRYFENLSNSPVLECYEADALRRSSVEANIYWLPGPSNITTIIYNKTLFAEYGWEVPDTFDEFIALCNRIREDTNSEVQPFNPNAKYSNELIVAAQAFSYEEILGGADNREWYNEFLAGNETFAGHMEPYYNMLQSLIDNGLLSEEHFTYSATTRGREFAEGKIAMLNGVAVDLDNDRFDFGYMPFPTTKGDIGYLCDSFSCFVGVPKGERSEKQIDAINRFLEYFSTPEGQLAFIGDSIRVSNVKNVPLEHAADLSELEAAVKEGHMFEVLDFRSKLGSYGADLWQNARDMANGIKTGAQCIEETDAQPIVTVTEPATVDDELIATVSEDFSILEFSEYIADMYRQKSGADIALINNGEAYRGNLICLFAGDIYASAVSVLKPRSFENGSTLVKAAMTGQQLTAALNNPCGNDCVSDSIYAFSGLKCEVAPWNKLGSKYLSVKLADGSPLEADKLYTVAFWGGTVSEKYITEILQTYEGTWEELMTAKMKADGSIAPARDGRIKLFWDAG